MRRGSSRPKLAIYGAAACGGCEMSLLSCNESLAYLNDLFELVFCPCLVDAKKTDLETFADGEIALTLFNGAIRMEDDVTMAHLLRRTSRILVAFGSCAHEGSVLGLANLASSHKDIPRFRQRIRKPYIPVREGVLHLPLWNTSLTTLVQNVPVDYILPGCPPEPHRIAEAFRILSGEGELPPAGSVIGAGSSTVCAECSRIRGNKKVDRFYRIHEKPSEPDTCLLDQGIVCMGIATRNGCGCLCPRANMPCSGCYGPPEGVIDQGAAMISALASVIDVGPVEGISLETIGERIERVIDTLPDHAGTFWKYGFAGSLLAGLGEKRQ